MPHAKLVSAAALLCLSATLLGAAPEERERKDDRGNAARTVAPARPVQNDTHHDVTHKPGTAVGVPSKTLPSHARPEPPKRVEKTVTPPGTAKRKETYETHVVRPKPPATVVLPAGKTHADFRRPPGVKPPPYYHRPGYVIGALPRLAVTLSLGGLLFYYADGIYYRRAASGYIVSVPPVGMVVSTLPIGYTVYMVGGRTYYYYADVYYVWDDPHTGYRVVSPPADTSGYLPGDIVETLPDGAYSVTVNGRQYFRYADVYFLQAIQNGAVVYVVVTP